MTTAEIIACFRLTVPAMSDVTDVELASDIDIYRYYVSEKVFGRLYGKALCYFIAHMRTLNDMIVGAVAAGSNAGFTTLVCYVIGRYDGREQGTAYENAIRSVIPAIAENVHYPRYGSAWWLLWALLTKTLAGIK